jgi:periplasmic protein TonB
MGGAASPASHGDDLRWDLLRRAIQRHVIYPVVARRLGWQGETLVAFIIDSTGQPAVLRILRSSGYDLLDKSALQAVARAAPLPAGGDGTTVVIPIVFGLH